MRNTVNGSPLVLTTLPRGVEVRPCSTPSENAVLGPSVPSHTSAAIASPNPTMPTLDFSPLRFSPSLQEESWYPELDVPVTTDQSLSLVQSPMPQRSPMAQSTTLQTGHATPNVWADSFLEGLEYTPGYTPRLWSPSVFDSLTNGGHFYPTARSTSLGLGSGMSKA